VLPLFILGIALLIGMILVLRWYVSTDPKTLVKVLKWVSLGVILVVGLFMAVTGRLAWAMFTLPVLIGWLMRFRMLARTARNFARMAQSTSAGGGTGSSQVETRFLRMSLDHETGAMDGDVLEGYFKGCHLNEMALPDLLHLLADCHTGDAQSAQVLEAYLDRVHDGWRAQASVAGGQAGASQSAVMDRQEALQVLGLEQGASEDDIKQAHHRLIDSLHPDHGGSTYLAAKINQAKDVLLGP